ncbi:hypothetical protein [Streptomyces sp. Ac-502]|uniref:hypothetical protein n=1 Tax=Streptomyces sp. Ac-502 TaxID=3342801 RepID=UPI00386258AB
MNLLDIIVAFARTGYIGAARLGAQLKDIAEVLGPPWAEGSSTGADGLPYLYAYGSLELGTCQAHCQAIDSITVQTDWPTMEWPSREPGQAETFPGRPAYSEVLRALDEAGCAWERHEPLTFEDQCAFRVPASGAVFVFGTDDGDEPTLHGVSAYERGPHACGQG